MSDIDLLILDVDLLLKTILNVDIQLHMMD